MSTALTSDGMTADLRACLAIAQTWTAFLRKMKLPD